MKQINKCCTHAHTDMLASHISKHTLSDLIIQVRCPSHFLNLENLTGEISAKENKNNKYHHSRCIYNGYLNQRYTNNIHKNIM